MIYVCIFSFYILNKWIFRATNEKIHNSIVNLKVCMLTVLYYVSQRVDVSEHRDKHINVNICLHIYDTRNN